MKKIFTTLLWIYVGCLLLLGFSGCTDVEYGKVDAEVLSVNERILEGQMIGHFLGSSDGWIKSDINKVGVKFEIAGRLFLEDLPVSHALLAFYKESKTLPLELKVCWVKATDDSKLVIRIHGYYIKKCPISKRLAKYIFREFENEGL